MLLVFITQTNLSDKKQKFNELLNTNLSYF